MKHPKRVAFVGAPFELNEDLCLGLRKMWGVTSNHETRVVNVQKPAEDLIHAYYQGSMQDHMLLTEQVMSGLPFECVIEYALHHIPEAGRTDSLETCIVYPVRTRDLLVLLKERGYYIVWVHGAEGFSKGNCSRYLASLNMTDTEDAVLERLTSDLFGDLDPEREEDADLADLHVQVGGEHDSEEVLYEIMLSYLNLNRA
jgi:hypothetical protein